MSSFELVFKPEAECNIVNCFKEGDVDYSYWGRIDILINGESFFRNYTYKVLSTPLIPMIEAITEALSILKNERMAIIEESTGQINKTIVCVLDDKGENVIIALCGEWDESLTWYDGEKVTFSKEMPLSPFNVINKEDFVFGCIESIRTFLQSLVAINPQLKDLPQYITWHKMLLTKFIAC
jgi:hypothetical protein